MIQGELKKKIDIFLFNILLKWAEYDTIVLRASRISLRRPDGDVGFSDVREAVRLSPCISIVTKAFSFWETYKMQSSVGLCCSWSWFK
jgi:hypothetical protein